MSIEITHVRYGSTPKTEDVITDYKWRNEQTGNVDSSNKPALVTWLDDKSNIAHVGSNPQATAMSVHPQGQNAYVRTVADGKYTNNLVNLPEF
jgi:hypothetical protein